MVGGEEGVIARATDKKDGFDAVDVLTVEGGSLSFPKKNVITFATVDDVTTRGGNGVVTGACDNGVGGSVADDKVVATAGNKVFEVGGLGKVEGKVYGLA